MVASQQEASDLGIDTGPFLAATILMGVGGLLAFIGFVVAALHAFSEGSRVVGDMDTPPSAMARSKVNQLRHAANVGATAWKGYDPVGASR